MRRPRDTQRSRLYAAEMIVRRGQEFTSVAEMQQYVDTVVARRWFRSRWGSRSVEVRDGRGFRRATCYPRGDSAVVYMPRRSRCQLVLLHEIAHAVQPPGTAWHGPEFCRIYLALVRHFMGQAEGTLLLAAYRAKRVRYRVARQVEGFREERAA